MEKTMNRNNMILRIIVSAIILLNPIFVKSQFYSIPKNYLSFAACFDGYWSDWKDVSNATKIKGDYSGFIIYNVNDGPWNYYFKFKIDYFWMPDKKKRREHRKENKWYEYTGVVEYYICDDYPNIYEIFKKYRGPRFISKALENGRPTKKITSRATIKIAPYKDHPKCYNIWFDNVGLGIDLNDLYFSE